MLASGRHSKDRHTRVSGDRDCTLAASREMTIQPTTLRASKGTQGTSGELGTRHSSHEPRKGTDDQARHACMPAASHEC